MASSPENNRPLYSYDPFLDYPPLTQTTTVASGHDTALEEPCQSEFLRFMAVAQLVGVDFLFVHWKEYALSGLGEGATGRIYQSPLSPKMGFAFKTFRKSSDPSLEAETYKALVAEMLVLCHPGVREHQNIVGLYGVPFDVIAFDLDGATHKRLWPVLVLEKSSHGDLATFFKDHSMSLQASHNDGNPQILEAMGHLAATLLRKRDDYSISEALELLQEALAPVAKRPLVSPISGRSE